jgi:hypothetical protein
MYKMKDGSAKNLIQHTTVIIYIHSVCKFAQDATTAAPIQEQYCTLEII